VNVALDYFSTRNLALVAAFTQDLIGVFDVTTKVPKYWNQYFSLYRYAFLTGVEVIAEFANVLNNPFNVVLAETNTTDQPTNTMTKLVDTPRSQFGQCIPAGNRSVIKFKHHVSGQDMIGRKVEQDINYWAQIASGPSLSYLPLLSVAFEPTQIGFPFTAVYTLKVRYHISFFTLNPQ